MRKSGWKEENGSAAAAGDTSSVDGSDDENVPFEEQLLALELGSLRFSNDLNDRAKYAAIMTNPNAYLAAQGSEPETPHMPVDDDPELEASYVFGKDNSATLWNSAESRDVGQQVCDNSVSLEVIKS